jgi:NADH-quinone oxidoreductase subunit C
MNEKSIVEQLEAQFGDQIVAVELDAIDQWIEIQPASLIEICQYLRDTDGIQLEMLNCITVVDYLQTDPKKAAKLDWEPHLEVVYHLSSISHKHSLVVKLKLDRWQDEDQQLLPDVPSVSQIWSTADWHEREVFDLSGVNFTGHPALKRILCPEDWVGYPLRKDYQMPQEYHGIRGR